MSDVEICPGCNQPSKNIGPWRSPHTSHTRLCGGCKVREVIDSRAFRDCLGGAVEQAREVRDRFDEVRASATAPAGGSK